MNVIYYQINLELIIFRSRNIEYMNKYIITIKNIMLFKYIYNYDTIIL
jgi:hypothetical protein